MKSRERDHQTVGQDSVRSVTCPDGFSTKPVSARRHPDGNGAIETLSTDDLPAAKRIEFWNEVVCCTFTSQTVDFSGDRFAARLRRLDLADVRLAVAESSAASVTHSRAQLSRS